MYPASVEPSSLCHPTIEKSIDHYGRSTTVAIRSSLPYISMRPYTDDEWETLPHVIITRDEEWDPTAHDFDPVEDDEDWVNALQDLAMNPMEYSSHKCPLERRMVCTNYLAGAATIAMFLRYSYRTLGFWLAYCFFCTQEMVGDNCSDFINRENWFRIKCLVGLSNFEASKTKGIKDKTYTNTIAKAQTAVGFLSNKKLHIGQQSGACDLEMDLDAHDIWQLAIGTQASTRRRIRQSSKT